MSPESLSSLFDGECSPEELDRVLDELDQSPDLKASFSRLCLSRDAVDGTRVLKGQRCIAAGVMAGLDDTPAAGGGNVRELVRPPRARPAFQWRPLAGLAAAAAFGAVAVLVTTPRSQDSGLVPSSMVPQVASPVGSNPVSAPSFGKRQRNLHTVAATQEQTQQWQEDDLRSYLIEHSNTLADRGMGGTLSYARFTAHTADYRPQAEAPASGIKDEIGTGDRR